MTDLGPAVSTVVRRCLGVRAGEEVVVVVDPAMRTIGEALRDEARAAGADAVLMVMDERATDGTEPPASIAAALAACDVFIAPTTRSLSHTSARKRATEAGARGRHDAGRDRGHAGAGHGGRLRHDGGALGGGGRAA